MAEIISPTLHIGPLVATTGDFSSNLTVGGTAAVTGRISGAGLTVVGTNAAGLGQLSVQSTGGEASRISFWDNNVFRMGIQVTATDLIFDPQNNQAFTFGGTGTKAFTGAVTLSSTLAVTGLASVGGSTPASAAATGVAGTITWDASYIYVCVATNTWERVAIASW